MKIFLKITLILILSSGIFSRAFSQNSNISQGNVFDGEPYLEINPLNTQHLVVAWMGFVPFKYISIKTKVSFNGGQTWSNVVAIEHTNPVYGSADPSLAFDSKGNLFLSYIDYDKTIDSGSVYVRKSIDGGLSWEAPVEVINIHSDPDKKPVDRPWINIDKSGGKHDGNIYITTMPPKVFGPLPPPYHPYFIRSTDGGSTFDKWKYIDDDSPGWLSGSIIPQPAPFSTVSKSGVFHCVYPSWVFTQNINPQYIFASSNNAGETFTYSSIEIPFDLIKNNDTLAKKGYPLISNPADENHLVFFHLIQPHGDSDVYMWESFDGGKTWSDSLRINDDPIGNNRMQDLIWADFDNDGDLVVSWRDRRNGDDSTYTTSSEIWGAVRNKDSTNFYPNFQITDKSISYDSVLAMKGNDFMCIKFRNDTINAVWGDPRSGRLNIWFQKMYYDGTILSSQEISSEGTPDIRIYPNPTKSNVLIKGNGLKRIVLLNINGEELRKYDELVNINEFNIDMNNFDNGVYFLRIITKNGIVVRKLIND